MFEARSPKALLVLGSLVCLTLSGCSGVPISKPYILSNRACVRPDCSRGETGPSTAVASVTASDASYVHPPVFDSDATCHASKEFGGAYCLTDEKNAKIQLVKLWTSFTLADRRSCVEQTRSYNPSYVETLTCLELSKGAVTPSASPFVPYASPVDRGPMPDYLNKPDALPK